MAGRFGQRRRWDGQDHLALRRMTATRLNDDDCAALQLGLRRAIAAGTTMGRISRRFSALRRVEFVFVAAGESHAVG